MTQLEFIVFPSICNENSLVHETSGGETFFVYCIITTAPMSLFLDKTTTGESSESFDKLALREEIDISEFIRQTKK